MASKEFLTQPFLNLTHLLVVPDNPRFNQGQWEFLTHLPKLTHIHLGTVIQPSEIWRLLQLLPLLKILILMPYYKSCPEADLNALVYVDDNRLVCVGEGDYVNLAVDWEIGTSGGMDTWIFAELVVLARASEYFLCFLYT